jgi:hypothetical protein
MDGMTKGSQMQKNTSLNCTTVSDVENSVSNGRSFLETLLDK